MKTNHTELRPEALESFVREHPLEQLAKVCPNERPIRTTVRHYLAGTPDAILHLLLKEIITIEQVSDFLQEAGPLSHFSKSCFEVFEHFFKERKHSSCAWEEFEQAVRSFLRFAQDEGEAASTRFLEAILALPEDAQGEIFLDLLKLAHQDVSSLDHEECLNHLR